MIDILDSTPDDNGLDGRHGAYTYGLARERLGDVRLRTAIETGELVGFGRGVLLDARRVLDLRTRSAGALLLTGGTGVLVGPTAAALHGCSAIGGFPIHVRVPYDQRVRSRTGLVVHQGPTRQHDTIMMDGLRLLAVDHAIAEALCAAPRRTALACADEVLHAMRPDDRAGFVVAVAERLATRTDRRGTKRAGMLLALATGLPESPTQSAFLLVLTDAGFPRPVCQHEVGRHRVDFAWPELRVALEYDGYQTEEIDHVMATARNNDLRRQGWQVVRADAQDLADPTALCGRLRTAFHTHARVAA